MKKLLSIVLATSLCIPALAQKQGMTNNNAPTIKQSIAAGEAKISLDYTAITWASGQWYTRLTEKDNTKGRARHNETAANSPLATMSTSVDLKINELTLPAGEYSVYFTIGDDLSWAMNFKNKDKVHTTKLNLMENPGHEHKRLVVSLYAGDDNGAGIYLGFGKQGGMLSLMPAGAKGAKEASGGK